MPFWRRDGPNQHTFQNCSASYVNSIIGQFPTQHDIEASHIVTPQNQRETTSRPSILYPVELSSPIPDAGLRGTAAFDFAAQNASNKTGRRVAEFDHLRQIQGRIPPSGNDGVPRDPTQEDFPKSISLTVVPRATEKPVEHAVVLLHDFAGTEKTLEPLATRLRNRQPETAFILLRGVAPVPTWNSGHHSAGSSNDWSETFPGACHRILADVVKTGLINECGFQPRNIVLLGHGQGGMAALATAAAFDKIELGGVVTIGGPLPAYAQLPENIKAKTPALVLRRDLGDIDAPALQRLRDNFVSLDVSTQPGVGNTIPEEQAEVQPLIDFLAHRLSREEWTQQAILSFDGGGIRGYGSLLILQDLMNKIGDEEKRLDDGDGLSESSFAPCLYKPMMSTRTDKSRGGQERPRSSSSRASQALEASVVPTATKGLPYSALFLPCHYFTYVAGTSTGGLISIMLSRFRMTVDDCIAEYKTLGAKIFGHPRPFAKGALVYHKFNYRVLEAVIKDVTSRNGERVEYNTDFPSDEELCRSIVLAFGSDSSSGIPHIFRTYRAPPPESNPSKTKQRQRAARNHGEAAKLPIWQVARATSAAPMYFPPITIEKSSGGVTKEIKFKDGGFGANNPSDEAYYDVLNKHGNVEKNIGPFISIGTGITPFELFAKGKGNIRNTIANGKALIKQPPRTLKVHEIMAGLSTRDQEDVFPYYRFDGGRRLGETKMDEWKSHKFTKFTGKPAQTGHKTLEKMLEATAAYLRQHDVQRDLTECAKLLVKRRRLRTRNVSAWERYASASHYYCTRTGCEKGHRYTRQLYREHLKEKHRMQVDDELLDETSLDSRHYWTYRKSTNSSSAKKTPSVFATASRVLDYVQAF